MALPGLAHELLEGLAFRSSPGFELWLENERRHVAGTAGAVLQQAALALLARGESEDAARYASELVRLNPYDENAHVLLVRSLRAAGDNEGAARRIASCTELFRRDLGVEPTAALRVAAEAPATVASRVSGRAAVLAQVEAGEAALAAGAIEAGVQHLRGAVVAARRIDDREPLATALVSLGGALVHSARGTDVEGAAALHEGTALAEDLGRLDIAATGWREISWVQFLRAQYETAERSLTRTVELAGGRDEELAWVDVIRGASRHDTGDHAAAGALLRSGVERAGKLPSGQPLGQALTMLGRFHFLRGEFEDAFHVLDQALAEVEARGMTAFTSWPESFRGELDIVLGDLDSAQARFEHAFALGCEVGDACWESIGLRGLGLVAAARGDVPRALDLLVDAPKLCRRLPGHVPLDRDLRAGRPLRGRGGASRRGRAALDRRARGDHGPARHPRAPAARHHLPGAARRARRARRRPFAGRADRQPGARHARRLDALSARPDYSDAMRHSLRSTAL